MRKSILTLTACLLFVTLVMPLRASELRGLWVDAWHPGFKTPEETTAMVNKARDCNFNTIFVQVRRGGDVYYRSKIEPMASDAAKDYDPLADVITKAHAAGLKVHAWIVVYRVYHDHPEVKPSPDQVYSKHPKWLTKDIGGNVTIGEWRYLDPAIPEVKAYLAGVVQEIAQNYDVDGIHLDRFAYPNRESGYSDAAVDAFNKSRGKTGTPKADDPDWCQWRRDQVTELLGIMRDKLIAKPKVRLSAAVSPNLKEAQWHRLEDWTEWVRSGKLDFAVPMLFARDLRTFETGVKELVSVGGKVYIGQGAWKMESKVTLDQIASARKLGAKGIVIYNYDSSATAKSGESTPLMDQLIAVPFASKADAPD
jgi:uncharacterized lipoprotein YddW (UPF0748 family)